MAKKTHPKSKILATLIATATANDLPDLASFMQSYQKHLNGEGDNPLETKTRKARSPQEIEAILTPVEGGEVQVQLPPLFKQAWFKLHNMLKNACTSYRWDRDAKRMVVEKKDLPKMKAQIIDFYKYNDDSVKFVEN